MFTSRNNSNESHSLAQAKTVLMIASSSCSGNIYFEGFKLNFILTFLISIVYAALKNFKSLKKSLNR